MIADAKSVYLAYSGSHMEARTTKPRSLEVNLPHGGWTKSPFSDRIFTADEALALYEIGEHEGEVKGIKKGREEVLEEQKIDGERTTDEFRGKILTAFRESERFFLDMDSDWGISPVKAYLRPCVFPSLTFETLYLVPERNFISDSMLNVIECAGEREDALDRNGLDLTFRFAPFGDSTDDRVIVRDGYDFYYERTQEQL